MADNVFDIIVIGGGAAGMTAAGFAAHQETDKTNKKRKNSVLLLEKNDRLGKKLYITGKGRCNITNASSPDECIGKIAGNPNFLYSAFYNFSPDDAIAFFNKLGVRTKTERGSRVFPVSDKAGDVVDALKKHAETNGVHIRLKSPVTGLIIENGAVKGVRTSSGEFYAGAVITATGGLSYPATGSTGDGYRFARAAGHTVTPLYPSLVALKTREDVSQLQGLSLKNINLTAFNGGKEVYSEFGEALFTEDGVSGPVVLSASRALAGKYGAESYISIDLKPALSEDELSARLVRDFDKYANKNFINSLSDLLPVALIPVMAGLSQIPPDKKANSITKGERVTFARLLKDYRLTITGSGGFDEAVVTAGGVCVDEINPSTMESKIIKGLYFAGEVIDVDGRTGGYNLQTAFSTGYLAGTSAAMKINN